MPPDFSRSLAPLSSSTNRGKIFFRSVISLLIDYLCIERTSAKRRVRDNVDGDVETRKVILYNGEGCFVKV